MSRPRAESAESGLTEARKRRAIADARLAELALAEREGRLIPVDVLDDLLTRLTTELRARILAQIGKYAPRIPIPIAQAQALLQDIANEQLALLRTTGYDVLGQPVPGDPDTPRRRGRPRGPGARTPRKRQRVG